MFMLNARYQEHCKHSRDTAMYESWSRPFTVPEDLIPTRRIMINNPRRLLATSGVALVLFVGSVQSAFAQSQDVTTVGLLAQVAGENLSGRNVKQITKVAAVIGEELSHFQADAASTAESETKSTGGVQ